MIRISDIMKMHPAGGPGKKDQFRETPSLLEKAIKGDVSGGIKNSYMQGMNLLDDVFKKARRARDLGVGEAEEFIANTVDFKSITRYLNQLVDSLLLDKGEMFDYFYNYRHTGYVYEHSLNVCLLTVKIGMWLDMNKSNLIDMALGGLLHDIGLISVEDIISSPRRLRHKERLKVKAHPLYGADILKKIRDFTDEALSAVRAHHRRLSDKDFTREVGDQKIQQMVQVIGLADVYEAITHPRSYKPAKLPHEAIKELVEKESTNFQSTIIKSLIENIGIYPIGSWVRITNGEIGIVVHINKNYPLRPRVNIVFDVRGNRLPETKQMDLLTEPHLHIESPVDLDKNKELIDKLK
ncbi:MAG: HD domain-containing phosphohydrolase [Candidatus Omnitrophota bacterium]